MKIFVKVKPGAREEKVEKIDSLHFKVAVKEPAKEGRANKAVISALAKYFSVSKSAVEVVSGKTSRQKIIKIKIK